MEPKFHAKTVQSVEHSSAILASFDLRLNFVDILLVDFPLVLQQIEKHL